MSLVLVFRLLFVCYILQVGESYAKKCTANENDKNLKVRHRWSQWTDWSPCTRPCGIGIQQRNRTCQIRRKRRKNGCVGPSTMHRICNTQDCTGGMLDIVSEQCSTFNNRTFAGKRYTWLPFQHLGRECSLHCRPLGQRFFAELSSKVADGTPCGKKSYCLEGKCLVKLIVATLSLNRRVTLKILDPEEAMSEYVGVRHLTRSITGNVTMITTDGLRMATTFILTVFIILEIGCNNVLGYTQTNCHGKNVSYHRTRGIYTQPHLKYGYNYIATIPSSARNISVSQHRVTSNHLVLMKNDGSYIINGNWVVDQPGNFKDCGTVFTYQQNQDGPVSVKEYVYSPGPLNQPIQLLLLAYEVNGGITYEYDTPTANVSSSNIDDVISDAALMSKNSFVQHRVKQDKNNTIGNEDVSTNRRRHWNKHYIWKICHKSCGDTTYETAVCVHHSTEIIVPEKQCSTFKKPVHEDYTCNTTNKPCLPEWVSSEWSPCSVTCGEGLHVREVTCKQLTSSGYPMILHSKACSVSPPPTIQKCHLKACDAVFTSKTWDVGQWSKCSSSCGEGVRTRTVTCRTSLCHPDDVPPSKESCYSVCPTQGLWLTSQGSTKASKVEMQSSINKYCSERCGSGWKMQNVICFGGKECSSVEQPNIYLKCRSDEKCPGQWFRGPWQKCSGICDEGNQKRDVVCLGKVQNEFVSVPEHNCKPEEKPITIQRCKLPECSATWYTTEWSTCSKSCGGGMQYRKVYCVKKNLESTLCPENEKPPKSQTCNTNICSAFIKDIECTDKHKYCHKAVVQARLCNYSYYKNLCCQSCTDKN